jgi:hypothetical protein
MKFFRGQSVKIIGASHSGPVEAMYSLVGGTFPIDSIFDEENYVIKGYVWHGIDLSPDKSRIIDTSAKLFDVNNLFV